jgi:hypothetical protein
VRSVGDLLLDPIGENQGEGRARLLSRSRADGCQAPAPPLETLGDVHCSKHETGPMDDRHRAHTGTKWDNEVLE